MIENGVAFLGVIERMAMGRTSSKEKSIGIRQARGRSIIVKHSSLSGEVVGGRGGTSHER